MIARRRFGLALLLTLATLAGLTATAEAVGSCSIWRTYLTGDSVTASELNNLQTTIGVTNFVLSCLDDYSANATQMQSTSDPYPGATESLATSLQVEITALRDVLKQGFGFTYWYSHSDDINRTVTWNSAAVNKCLFCGTVTDTQSHASSRLIDMRVLAGGAPVSKFSVDKDGNTVMAGTLTATGSGLVPTGAIVMIDGTLTSCPSGYTEVTAARGFHLVAVPSGGTLAGTVGSAMTNQQNLSVTPTFTGSALASHSHVAPVKFTTVTGKITDDYGTDGVSRTEDWTLGGGAAGGTDTGWSITSSTSAGTPPGTVSAVTGGGLAPYFQVMLCRKT